MKLLLTSLGLTNNSIANTLADLIGKEPKDSKVAFVITGANAARGDKNWLIDHMHQIKQYGYHVDIIEIIAMEPTEIKKAFDDVDAIIFGGGNCFYLSYWM